MDDERVTADTLVIILNQQGDDAHSTYTGTGAVEEAHRLMPDLIISDIVMPDLNGVEAMIRVRAFLPGCRILLFDGSPDMWAGLLEDARAQGHDFELVGKPADPRAFLHWCSVDGHHDVRACEWCQERRAVSGGVYPHDKARDSCSCGWCQGLKAALEQVVASRNRG